MPDSRRAEAREQIIAALDAYDLGSGADLSPLQGHHLNDPHIVSTDRGRFFVKLLAPHVAAPPAVHARHAFIEHLLGDGVPVPHLLRTQDGATHVRVGPRVVELYQFVEGRGWRRGDPDDARQAGAALARLHAAAHDFRPPSPGLRRGWLSPDGDLETLRRFEEQMRTYVPAPEAFEPVERVKAAVRDTSAALAAADLPAGMVHGDFVPENLIYGPADGPVITDFDYCHEAPLIFDLATVIVGSTGSEPQGPGTAPDPAIVAEVMAGYREHRPLTGPEQRTLSPAVQRVLVHLHLERGSTPERIANVVEWWEAQGAI